jgi:hypothetical protein
MSNPGFDGPSAQIVEGITLKSREFLADKNHSCPRVPIDGSGSGVAFT